MTIDLTVKFPDFLIEKESLKKILDVLETIW